MFSRHICGYGQLTRIYYHFSFFLCFNMASFKSADYKYKINLLKNYPHTLPMNTLDRILQSRAETPASYQEVPSLSVTVTTT